MILTAEAPADYSEVSGPDIVKTREDPDRNLDDAAGILDDTADNLNDAASDLDDSSSWFTGSINLEFEELQSELQRCGLELYSYI